MGIIINKSIKKDYPKRKGKKKKWNRDDTELTVLAVPSLIWYLLFAYLPMFGIIIAFKKYKVSPGHSFLYSLLKSDWVGIDNFKYFISSKAFAMLLRNTILYNLVFLLIGVVVSVGLAMMISNLHNKRVSKVYQTLMFFPYFMSWVVIAYFVYAVLTPDKGYLNSILASFGRKKIMWYQEAVYWPFILTFMRIWKGMGYGMVIYLASITGIDQALYEAAVMDGANKWQQTKYITFPCLKPIIIMMLILDTGKIFYSDFGLFYQITAGIPQSLYNTVSTFDTYIYKAIQSQSSIGRAAAASFFQSVACCITILLANWFVSKVDRENTII
jgi:putative aldouronate transport system permease protein